jgi:hypothetical protein
VCLCARKEMPKYPCSGNYCGGPICNCASTSMTSINYIVMLSAWSISYKRKVFQLSFGIHSSTPTHGTILERPHTVMVRRCRPSISWFHFSQILVQFFSARSISPQLAVARFCRNAPRARSSAIASDRGLRPIRGLRHGLD